MLARVVLLCPALLLGSCGESGGGASAAASTLAGATPQGAPVRSGGYLTITDAPPAPFETAALVAPPTRPPSSGRPRFSQAGRFQSEVRPKVDALVDTLRAREPGNFVDLYFENEGEPRVVFSFLRNPERTLARYTTDPRFVAETARYTEAELRAAMDFMLRTFREDRVVLGGGIGNRRNRAVVEIGVTEPEFRALVARKGVTLPAAVELRFVAAQPAAALNRPLAPEIAGRVRLFQRDDRPAGPLEAVSSTVKVVLRDGCFRLAGGADDGAHVLFPLGAQLFVDRQGHLAFGEAEAPGYARVGETLVTPGIPGEVRARALAAPIHKACGPGKVVKIHGMRSSAADRAQQTAHANAQALQDFREAYGLPEPVARRALERCKAQTGSGICMMSPPAPPRPGGPDCPAGTRETGGMCRTPEGYVRPIPEWLQPLIR